MNKITKLVNNRTYALFSKWFKLLFGGTEWQAVIQSLTLLAQIKEYQKEEN